jgi:4-hydroxybenzoyl-CoA reductase subunit alpha
MARETRVFTNGGAYTGMGATALYLTGFFHSFPYKWNAYRYDGYRVYTNTLPSTSMRGFGAPQGHFCSEMQIDLIARDLGLDRMEIRHKNAHTPNYEVPGQATIASCGLTQCLDKIDEWIKSRGKLPANRDRHIVLQVPSAGFLTGSIPYSFSSAVVTINYYCRVDLHVGAQDIRQGSNTAGDDLREELGVRVEDIRTPHTTGVRPTGPGAQADRRATTKMAAADAKKQLLERHAQLAPALSMASTSRTDG